YDEGQREDRESRGAKVAARRRGGLGVRCVRPRPRGRRRASGYPVGHGFRMLPSAREILTRPLALPLVAAVIGATVHSAAAPPAPLTFTKDIAPILFARCAECHHPGGPAPFSVLDYDSVVRHATQIARVTRARQMPPWKADPDSGEFVGQRHLRVEEIDRIAQWADEGAAKGEARDLPDIPVYRDGWQLGTPDLIVTAPAYTLTADGGDVFRIFVVPLPTTRVRYVRGLEFRTGNARVVHHANIRIDRTDASRALDEKDPGAGYEG